MAEKNYLINDKWLDIDNQNIVEVKSTDGIIGSVKLNGEEYGGGANYKAYDAVIDFDADGSKYTFKIIKGSYAEIVALLNDEIPPNILVKSWVKNNETLHNAKASSSVVLLYANNSELSDPYVAFAFYVDPSVSVVFCWHSDDTVK